VASTGGCCATAAAIGADAAAAAGAPDLAATVAVAAVVEPEAFAAFAEGDTPPPGACMPYFQPVNNGLLPLGGLLANWVKSVLASASENL
jgi:hypothetical protein